MNKNRLRTQRRMALRAHRRQAVRVARIPQLDQQTDYAPPTRTELALDFEIQRRDASGRWRKAPGVPRVHTFSLARLRAQKAARPFTTQLALITQHGAYPTPKGEFRVRNVKTGDAWTI